ncbi:RNA-directed DNA polymerase, eukaryota, reverse transcriptase zinc-binding domain protein [Tanacetum coccineum]|uniref:RNA-directed DNA polymerase, eukaryota, reverse transcriptase zinc-binding domain protein n=1 Tax=Tanacetum coccineum TaxID=301880 RepID=A0ABQ5CZ28_9ASTR
MVNRLPQDQSEFLEGDISRDEIKRAVWDCGGDRAFPKGYNSSFIALIPKVSNATLVTDFRPISLIGCQYKIIGKILANRLSMVIGSCISPEQSAFIKDRNILDGPLVLSEMMAWHRKNKKKLMIFKVDFEKAFDSLKWDFLDLVMDKIGFGCRWRPWIKGCLRNARASVLVNGSPTKEYEIFRGLRQGNPLSPFLFILAMEGLHTFICKAMNMGIFKSISIGDNNLRISHIMYADDVIFMGMSNDDIQAMANVIGCGVATLPADMGEKKMTWVRWEKCLASKNMGGPGIRSIFALNVGLLFKWIWRFLCNSTDLWIKVIKEMYGFHGGIFDVNMQRSSLSPWCGILSSIKAHKNKGIDLLSLCSRKLGNGVSIRFWDDVWANKAEKEKAENRKKLQDLEDDILLNRPQSVIDGYNRWMSHGDYAEPYAIRVNKEVFRQADESYFAINATDIIELLTDQELECGILTLFEMSLYHLKGHSSQNKVGFLNPRLITADSCFYEKWATIDYLTQSLMGYEFYLAPYLQGRHYVLFIICPKHGMGFILNSSKGSNTNEQCYRLAGLVESVVGSLKWECPLVNRQPGDWECGYYVMKWMHDFVLKYQNENFPNIVPWTNERPLENRELNAIIGAWFTLWRD